MIMLDEVIIPFLLTASLVAGQTAAERSYDAIKSGDPRGKLVAIDASLGDYLTADMAKRRNRAATAFAYGPIAVSGRRPPPELAAALVWAASDVDARVRREALLALGTLSPNLRPDEEKSLIALLTHEDAATRKGAAATLGRLRTQAAGDALIAAMNDREPEVKAAAMRALGELRYERAVQSLNDQLKHYKSGPVALAAFEGLAGIGHSSSVESFERALGDRESAARRLAAEGLGRSGNTGSVLALEASIAKERDAFARLAMAFGLCALGRPAQERLIDGLRSERTAPQAFAYFLELDGTPAAAATQQALDAATKDSDPPVRELAARLLDRMRQRK
jgi:HEAT repeat protein